MAVLLTNGTFYIALKNTGRIIKVSDIRQAHDFHSIDKAILKKKSAPSKCSGYYYIIVEDLEETHTIIPKIKRRKYSVEERKIIYGKANGYCQLCGRKIAFEDMTIDHIIPLANGGSNAMENTQAACLICNRFKANIYPDQFFDRISEVFIYQMQKKYGDNLTWKMSRNMLMELL